MNNNIQTCVMCLLFLIFIVYSLLYYSPLSAI